ncbi:MAG: GTPase [Ghiorsea sp.]|nr:GTPase [Ghiorsea sp.]
MSKLTNILKKRTLKAQYLSKADLKTYDTLKRESKSHEAKVTCMGLYNHGKSSLLNALIDDLDCQTFKTADVRETSKNKSFKAKHFTYVDTPGLNAQTFDDKRVMEAVKSSDLNIFVHNVNTGEFVAKEMEFFQQIKTYWKNPKQFIERTLFVLSRIDEANHAEDIEATAQKMHKQIQHVFQANATIIPVSAMDYLLGRKENEEELVQISHIPDLQSMLMQRHQQYQSSVQADKQARFDRYRNQMMQKLNAKYQKKLLSLSQTVQAQKEWAKNLEQDIERIQHTLKQKEQMLREV